MSRATAALTLAAALLALPATIGTAHAAPDAARIARGEYLTRAADCVVCHTATGGEPFAGGLGFKTPFGTIFSSNITLDPKTGLGHWTEAQFAAAVRQGVRADGQHLYPAMPYTSYVKLTDADVSAIWAYLGSLPSVPRQVPDNVMGFPYNQRAVLAGWNLLNFTDTPFQPDPTHDATWNRGKYVATALGHCEECHTPRNLAMGLTSRAYGGALVDQWQAFNISSDPKAGIGSWSAQDLETYLHTGALPGKASAAGPMADVISHSTRFLDPADLTALATYLKTIPPQHGSDDDAHDRFGTGQPNQNVALTVRGQGAAAPHGASLYAGNCAACHGADGGGDGHDTYYPSLFHNSAVGASRPDNLVQVILGGVHRVDVSGHKILMPAFNKDLSDADIATLATYVRGAFGPGDTVTPEFVAGLRANEVRVIPGWILVAAPLVGGVIVVVILAWWLQRRQATRKDLV